MVVVSLIAAALFIALLFGPRMLITHTMRKHSSERPDFPGTGAELARELLDKAGLNDVKIEMTHPLGDHYSTAEKTIRLSEANFSGRSLTAVAVAAHECAHAVQHRDGYGPLMWRQKLVGKAIIIERVGSVLLMASPLVFAFVRSPAVLLAEIAAALAIMASTIVVHLVTLPTELDASFKRALPALTHYISPEDMPGARAVLRAAAFTYLAGALVSLLNIARWLRILRF
jgi:uncharacterized protein